MYYSPSNDVKTAATVDRGAIERIVRQAVRHQFSSGESNEKSLKTKLARIRANPSCKDFILADAKDADMAFGMAAPGKHPRQGKQEGRFRSLCEYREIVRQNVSQGLVDIMLMSASVSERLTIEERIFDGSTVTPAVRANDTTDIWLGVSGNYKNQSSLAFRTATIDQIQCGRASSSQEVHNLGADLGLYSITFNNDAQLDCEALASYREFRVEAEAKGFRHFLEVFAPNAPRKKLDDVARFVNDSIARCLAGIPRSGRPLFLKIPYFGPAAMEQLVHYDPTLIVGILGGPAGTTHDAFRMLWEAKKYGGRAALFGRKINNAEDQLAFVSVLRALADGNLAPEEAVRHYHGRLQATGIPPQRSLDDDLQLTQVEVS